jgi:hypothetical protein
MNAADFRRIALSFEGAEESSHMGAADFRGDGRIFATSTRQHLLRSGQTFFFPLPVAGAGWA